MVTGCHAPSNRTGDAMARVVVAGPTREFREALLESYAVSERMNQLILTHLDPKVWRAMAPGNACLIVAIFTHMHNIRRKWLRLSAPHIKLPPELDRAKCTQRQASAALRESSKCCSKMLAEAWDQPQGRVKQFHRDGWARRWPAGAAMFTYMIVHDAHHRGQVCMLAHQLGFPLPSKVTSGIWSWERLWKECGFSG